VKDIVIIFNPVFHFVSALVDLDNLRRRHGGAGHDVTHSREQLAGVLLSLSGHPPGGAEFGPEQLPTAR